MWKLLLDEKTLFGLFVIFLIIVGVFYMREYLPSGEKEMVYSQESLRAKNPLIRGRSIYLQKCNTCHGPGKKLGTMVLTARLGDTSGLLVNRDSLPGDYIKKIVRQGKGSMPGFRPSELSNKDLKAVVTFIHKPGEATESLSEGENHRE